MLWFDGAALFVVEAVPVLLLAVALGLLIGWVIWGRSGRRPAAGRADAAQIREAAAGEAGGASGTTGASAATVSGGTTEPVGAPEVQPDPQPELAGPDDADARPVEVPEPVVVAEADTTDADEASADDQGRDDQGRDDQESEAPGDEAQGSDDIERIDGIGPKIGNALRLAGLDSFRAIAEAPPEQIRQALLAQGLTFAPRSSTWSEQARALAAGGDAGSGREAAGQGRG